MTVTRGETAIFSLTLVNSKIPGEVLRNKDVTIKFRGVTYTVRTDNNGMASLNIPTDGSFSIATYYIVTSFAKDSVTNKIKIVL